MAARQAFDGGQLLIQAQAELVLGLAFEHLQRGLVALVILPVLQRLVEGHHVAGAQGVAAGRAQRRCCRGRVSGGEAGLRGQGQQRATRGGFAVDAVEEATRREEAQLLIALEEASHVNVHPQRDGLRGEDVVRQQIPAVVAQEVLELVGVVGLSRLGPARVVDAGPTLDIGYGGYTVVTGQGLAVRARAVPGHGGPALVVRPDEGRYRVHIVDQHTGQHVAAHTPGGDGGGLVGRIADAGLPGPLPVVAFIHHAQALIGGQRAQGRPVGGHLPERAAQALHVLDLLVQAEPYLVLGLARHGHELHRIPLGVAPFGQRLVQRDALSGRDGDGACDGIQHQGLAVGCGILAAAAVAGATNPHLRLAAQVERGVAGIGQVLAALEVLLVGALADHVQIQPGVQRGIGKAIDRAVLQPAGLVVAIVAAVGVHLLQPLATLQRGRVRQCVGVDLALVCGTAPRPCGPDAVLGGLTVPGGALQQQGGQQITADAVLVDGGLGRAGRLAAGGKCAVGCLGGRGSGRDQAVGGRLGPVSRVVLATAAASQ